MEKYKILIEYLNFNHILGCSDLAPLICFINEDTKIVKELLDKDYIHKNSLISFLDYGVRKYIGSIKEDYSKYDLEETYNAIVYVLKTFNGLENKWSINSVDFIKALLGGKENEN